MPCTSTIRSWSIQNRIQISISNQIPAAGTVVYHSSLGWRATKEKKKSHSDQIQTSHPELNDNRTRDAATVGASPKSGALSEAVAAGGTSSHPSRIDYKQCLCVVGRKQCGCVEGTGCNLWGIAGVWGRGQSCGSSDGRNMTLSNIPAIFRTEVFGPWEHRWGVWPWAELRRQEGRHQTPGMEQTCARGGQPHLRYV